jgi:large subunit ribosomal protein L21
MFAVIKTGGKQYRVAKDDIILVERLPGDAGAAVSLDEVLMVGEGQKQTVGAPLVSGASVAAKILDHPRSDKIIVFKKNRRKNYRRRAGHRQDLTVLQITDIMADGKKAAKSATAVEKPAVENPASVKPAAAKSKTAKTKPATATKTANAPAKTEANAKPAKSKE